jgi:hypothetical protein
MACGLALGQSYSIDWFSIAGGGSSTKSQYSVSGAIGQPEANMQAITGANCSLTGGFWSLTSVVHVPGPPALNISLTATNTVVVSWPSLSGGWNLQQNSELNTTNWVVPSEQVMNNGTTKLIILNASAGNRFYRLFKP